MLALGTGTNFELSGSIRIDVGGKQQFVRVIAERNAVAEFDHGKSIVEHFKRGFLSLSLDDVTHHKHGLAFPLRAEITQRMLRRLLPAPVPVL